MPDFPFASEKPSFRPPTIDDIVELQVKGPWRTKSDGQLNVLFAMPPDQVVKFMSAEEEELRRIPQDIRGLRYYTVTGLEPGKIGGTEFHRIRRELFFTLTGSMTLECEDVFLGKKEYKLTPQKGVNMPPFLLHTYRTLEPSGFLVVANTLFVPDDPRTHDTYSTEAFRVLQQKFKD